MNTPERNQNNGNDDDSRNVATTSSAKGLDSPKTPVRPTVDDSFDEDTDEMESPQFPHLLPVYSRKNSCEYDLEGVRIGWDDGCGSVCYGDDDYVSEKGNRKIRSRNRLFSERRHRSLFGRHKFSYNSSPSTNSPSPRRSSINNTVLQAELNDYLGRILTCLSANKRNRQLMKSKNDSSSSTNNTVENNNIVSSLLNDSADDEMMLMCSQAIENKIAADTNFKNLNTATDLLKSNSLSIVGISPLKDTNNTINNNDYYHVAKKFKPLQFKLHDDKKSESLPSQCQSVTTNAENKSRNHLNQNLIPAVNTVTNSNKEDSSFFLNDSLASEDDLFSSIDLSAIEQQVVSNTDNKTYKSALKKQQFNQTIFNRIQHEKKPDRSSSSSVTSNTNSVLWRRFSSSSVVNEQSVLQKQNIKSFDAANGSNGDKTTGTTRYCTPAEIEAKRERARRTLMLKFKSKNKSAS